MSVIFNQHTSVVYESKGKNKTVAFGGQRLVVTVAKADKDGNYGQHLQQTMATSVPVLTTIPMNNPRVVAACVEYFQTVQNKVIGSRIKDDGQKSHSDNQIGIDACLAYLDAESSGDRWDSTRIAQWFADVVGDYLGAALLNRNPSLDNSELEKLMLANQDFVVTACAGRKTTVKQAETVKARLELVPVEKRDRACLKFLAKMELIINPPPVAETLAENLGL